MSFNSPNNELLKLYVTAALNLKIFTVWTFFRKIRLTPLNAVRYAFVQISKLELRGFYEWVEVQWKILQICNFDVHFTNWELMYKLIAALLNN